MMLTYPNIDPIAFYLFSWPVYWYGLMYLIGFAAGWILLAWRVRYSSQSLPFAFSQDQLSDIVFYAALGAILGGRIGYMLFYDWQALINQPSLVFQTWKGGMSFHGGLLGTLIAMTIYGKCKKIPFLALTDLIAPVVPIGLGAGRIGNFINSELWGRTTTMSWGIVFPNAGILPRHPSQLYEFLLEGIVLFIVLWLFSRKRRPFGAISGLFALGYGLFRSIIEFFREPDIQIGYLFGWITEGQLLSLPLILAGIILLITAYKRKRYA